MNFRACVLREIKLSIDSVHAAFLLGASFAPWQEK
jgi:hypothetical protein